MQLALVFPLVGKLPKSGLCVATDDAELELSEEELWEKRRDINVGILDTLTEASEPDVIWDKTMEDAVRHANSEPFSFDLHGAGGLLSQVHCGAGPS